MEKKHDFEGRIEILRQLIRVHVNTEIARELMKGKANIRDGGRVMNETILMNRIRQELIAVLERAKEGKRDFITSDGSHDGWESVTAVPENVIDSLIDELK